MKKKFLAKKPSRDAEFAPFHKMLHTVIGSSFFTKSLYSLYSLYRKLVQAAREEKITLRLWITQKPIKKRE